MFCPKCAAQNVEGASFCRVCGANISLVPQALAGKISEPASGNDSDRISFGRRRRREAMTLDRGIMSLFMGLAFIAVAFAVMFKFPGGFTWGWCFFFPGFSCLGRGIAAIVSASKAKKSFPPQNLAAPITSSWSPATRTLENRVTRNTGELIPPPASVTEGTTRHLGTERTPLP